MGLMSKEVEITLTGSNIKYYEEKGYKIFKRKDKKGRITTPKGTKILIKVEDLTDNSHAMVLVQCDECGEVLKPMPWRDYLNYVKEDGKYYCQRCACNLYGNENLRKSLLRKNGNSFYNWCIEHDRQDILDRWDYEKNKLKPNEIGYKTNKKFWFKCPRGIHPSELKKIAAFTSGQEGSFDCNMCNSFAQWGYDNIDNDFLSKYWDWEKNEELGIDPWKIDKSSRIIFYIFCQEKSYHGSYPVACNNFYRGARCPYCDNNHGVVHRFDSLGWLYPEVLYIWSEKNKKSPYEYTYKSEQKVWWKCLDGKHKDYKRSIKSSNKCEFRCPECVQEIDESIIQNKTRLYLESLGHSVLHEHSCTIVPVNPKTKHQLPFDNEIRLVNRICLICEVMGIQHYEELEKNNKWLKGLTPKEYLHYQKLKDRYKRFIAYKNGYEYLELPYWIFDKNDTYKKLIDDKINRILSKNISIFKEVI